MSYLDNFLDIFFNVLILAIIARAFLSWLPFSPHNPLVRVVYEITEPILAPLRRLVPRFGALDMTPLIALILLQVLRVWLSSLF